MTTDVSYFECPACGAVDRTTKLAYDSLGYAVCLTCGARPGRERAEERVDAGGRY